MTALAPHMGQLFVGMSKAAEAALPWIEQWGLMVVGFMVFAEFVAGIGYISQANTTLVAAGMVYGRSTVQLLACILVAAVAAVAGSLLSRSLGRSGRGLTGERLDRPTLAVVARAVREHAGLLAFAFHFSAWLRPAVPLVAGASGVPERKWLLWDVAGAVSWVSLLILLGVRMRGMLYRTAHASDFLVLVIVAVMFGAVSWVARVILNESRSGSV